MTATATINLATPIRTIRMIRALSHITITTVDMRIMDTIKVGISKAEMDIMMSRMFCLLASRGIWKLILSEGGTIMPMPTTHTIRKEVITKAESTRATVDSTKMSTTTTNSTMTKGRLLLVSTKMGSSDVVEIRRRIRRPSAISP